MTNIKNNSSTKRQTLGQRLNNPTCIRYSRYNNWNGQIGQSKGFAKFISADYCVRATCIILCRYIFTYYFTSVSEIISRWAPSSDGNDTKSYINFVYGCLRDSINITDFRCCSSDREFYRLISYMICAISEIESGSYMFTGNILSKPLYILVSDYCNEYCLSVLHVPTPYQALLKYKLVVPY